VGGLLAGGSLNRKAEDWPVMPLDVLSFRLKPFGFVDRNLSLDVVAAPPDMCHPEVTSAPH
jgi:primary-amine oxidase